MSDEVKVPEEQGKVQKEFNNNVDSISALLGKTLPKKKKRTIGGGLIAKIAEGLIEKQEKALIEEVTSDLEKLSEGYIQVNQEFDKLEKQLQSEKEKKMKEFNEQAKALLKKVEDLPEIRRNYESTIRAANAGGTEGAAEA